jgi:endonuclease/exonuclease/phosphatase family metal-dependent hydrolase
MPIPIKWRVGTFNLFNLVLPGTPYYGEQVYDRETYDQKIAWIAGQLRAMEADVVGFQEVFHEAALREALSTAGGRYAEAAVHLAPGDEGKPCVALASALPVVEVGVHHEFPIDARIDIAGVELPLHRFSRPVLRARLEMPVGGQVEVFVVHLKSKRPDVPDGADPHDPLERAKGKVRSLTIRAAEAAALRAMLLDTMSGGDRPVVVVGDCNDVRDSVTTEIVSGTPPWHRMPRELKQRIWDRLLYDVKQVRPRGHRHDVTYTHVHNGRHETLDHILVSQEFMKPNRSHLGVVEYVREFNDHLVDSTMFRDPLPRHTSDHAQVVATLAMREPRGGGRPA